MIAKRTLLAPKIEPTVGKFIVSLNWEEKRHNEFCEDIYPLLFRTDRFPIEENLNLREVQPLNELPNRSLTIFSEKIPVGKKPKYIGDTISKSLNYSLHTNQIKAKCVISL